jgi:hypothetical protein
VTSSKKRAYPRECEVLVPVREPTERERWIDLGPGAENPRTPTKLCGAVIANAGDDSHHWASVHPDIWAVIHPMERHVIIWDTGHDPWE